MSGYQGGYQTCPACKGRIYVEWGCLAECSCGFAEGARCKIHGEYDPDLPHCPDCGPEEEDEDFIEDEMCNGIQSGGDPATSREYAERVCAECREPITNRIKVVEAKSGALFHGRCWRNDK